MSDEQQRKVFAKMLNHYILLNGKQQIDVAKDLKINPTTLNMWCNGNSMPGPGKIRTLADYFNIGMTDLLEEKESMDEDEEFSSVVAKIGAKDERFKRIITAYYNMPIEKKEELCDFFEKFIIQKEQG